MGYYGTKNPSTGEETVVNTGGLRNWGRPPSYKLESCPKCGTKQGMLGLNQIEPCVHLIGIFADDNDKGWTVSCMECNFHFPEFVSDAQTAIDSWNQYCKESGDAK